MKEPQNNQNDGVTGGQSASSLRGWTRSSNFDAYDSNMLNEIIVENINHALIVLNSSSQVIRHNRKFLEIFQIDPVREASFSLSDVMPDNRLASIIRQSYEAEEPLEEIEYSCQLEGHERHFLLSTSWIDLSASEKGVLVTFNEITEWKHHQAQVMEASRLVSIGEMAAGIAHEVNNPLAAVMGFTQLAMRRNQDSSITRDLEKILAESKRASKIITNLQSFARRYKPNKVDVDIISIIRKVLEFRAYELGVNNITVESNLGSTPLFVNGDEHQLEQVVLNVVINAEYFIFDANGGGTLTIDAVVEDDKVKLVFTDDGPGINTENLPKIFDPFFTTKEVGKGTGLGLSICYGIVHEHDGTIAVESEAGKGATFIVEFPASNDDQSSGAIYNPAQYNEAAQRSITVLVVDDEPGVAEVVSRALRDQGHTVDVDQSGTEVIQRDNLDDYDLFILDIKMPGIGGAALYEHIESKSIDLSSKVLFITGDTTNPGIKEFIDRTSSPLLTKPFTIEELVLAVNRFIYIQSPAYLDDPK